jgi:5-methylcytosine-specific restriction endonuclease McrA
MPAQVLVLNSNYQPLNVTSYKKAYRLTYLGKAEVLETAEGKPSVLRVHKFVRRPYGIVALTKKNIFARDNYTCMYCGTKEHVLTVDHIIPLSRQGIHTWENVTTACLMCNNKKGNKLLHELKLRLRETPRPPVIIPYVSYGLFLQALRRDDWSTYLSIYRPVKEL